MLLDFELLPFDFTLSINETNLKQHFSISEYALFQRYYDKLRLRKTLTNHKTNVLMCE
jgi:hypothetical protein